MHRAKPKKRQADWEGKHPERAEAIISKLRNVAASHLADPALHDFAGLDALRAVAPDADPGLEPWDEA